MVSVSKKIKLTIINLLIAASFMTFSAQAEEVEVLHYWTSGGEAKSVKELKRLLEAKGVGWKDFAVAGGAGESAVTVLKARVVAGNPPSAAQIKGPAIQEWGETGALASIDATAKKENWDKLLPAVVSKVMKYKGKYVAAPVNVHRVNWMWVNPDVFKKAKAKIPTTWKEFFVAAEKIKKAGFIAVAHGGQAWQDATTFESVVLGTTDANFYRKVFVDIDTRSIQSPRMIQALKTFKRIKQYTDKGAPGRDWNLATAMVINGKAAMQFMGDWAKGEFTVANKVPGKDFVCIASPGSRDSFTFNIDSFIMFGDKATKGQNVLASTILGVEFQEIFNLNKGSIPARLDVSMAKFDDCAKLSAKDFASTSKSKKLVPSMAHGMSTTPSIQGAFVDTITEYYNSKTITAKEAVIKLAKAIKNAKM